jgi:hypothetical protein
VTGASVRVSGAPARPTIGDDWLFGWLDVTRGATTGAWFRGVESTLLAGGVVTESVGAVAAGGDGRVPSTAGGDPVIIVAATKPTATRPSATALMTKGFLALVAAFAPRRRPIFGIGLLGVVVWMTSRWVCPVFARSMSWVLVGSSGASGREPAAATASSIDGHRSSGTLRSIRITALHNCSGTSGRSSRSDGGSSWKWLYMIAIIDEPVNGVRPVSIS